MSRPRSQKFKLDNASTADESYIATLIGDGTDSESMPFLEWSDQDINMEKWEMLGKTSLPQANVFEDPQEVHLPPSLGAHQWKRCSEIFPDVSFSIFVNRSTYPDLVTPNQHLLQSEFYRGFISSIETLLYLGNSKPFPEEYGSPVYYAPSDRAWRPWHHIYSNCKVTKGNSEHNPLYNPSGKYVVRLYWMGCWRKIYVDDLIPIDKTNSILLPSLYIPKVQQDIYRVEQARDKHGKNKKGGGQAKKEIVELWPMILCKALLKIGALSWSTRYEFIDFDIINCLTGWVPQKIKTIDIPASDLWDILMAYGERFQCEEPEEEGARKSGSSKAKAKKKEIAEVGKKGTKSSKTAIPSGIENMKDGNRYIMASCDNFEFDTGMEKVFQNNNYRVLVSQVRDIPVDKPPPRPELELWKKFRYEEWTVKHGIIPPDIPKLNIKSLKIVDPFKRIFNMHQEVEELESKTGQTQATQESENIDRKSKKSSNSLKQGAAKSLKKRLQPDPTMWIDFDELKAYVDHIHIYFQPRGFKSKAKISDINFIYKTTDCKHIVSPIDLKTRNEPIYLFMDSIDYKFLVINFTQIGNLAQLEKHTELPDAELDRGATQVYDLCVEIVMKKTEEISQKVLSISEISNKSTLMCSFNTKPVNFVMEEYRWYTNSEGRARGMVRTYGNKSIMLDIKPGRTSFRLWISSHCSYVLQVFADTSMTIGNQEEYILACTSESQLLTNMCFDFSSYFGKLVQSFGMPEYLSSLRNFYHCYKPFQNLKKTELVTVHRALFEEFSKVISNNFSPNTLECIELLFLQLKTYDYINPYNETPHICPEDHFSRAVQTEYAKEMQRAAVKLQAFFKGIYVRQLMKKHNDAHKQYYGIFEALKKVYTEIFSSEKRLIFCPNLFRRLFERKDMEKLKEKFETYKDMESILHTDVFTDSVFVHEGWITICRYEFHINSTDPIVIKINLFCNLKTFYVRVFNNDTLQEVKRHTNNVFVEEYESNMYGYTILCYGWAEENTRLNWKLILAKKKMSRNDLVIIPSNPITTISLRNHYMPNFDNVICKYIIKVNLDMFLTAHLRTSYDQVNVCFRLRETGGKILFQTNGCGSALLPVLHLRGISTERAGLSGSIRLGNTRQSTLSGYSDITYSRLNKYGESQENTSVRSGSQKRISVDFNANHEPEDKSTRRRTVSEVSDNDGDNMSNRHGERSREGKTATKKGKTRQSDLSDSDSVSEKTSKRGSFKQSKSSEKLHKGLFSQRKNRSNTGTRPGTLTKLIEGAQREYILEGTVLKDSWPLTAEGWEKSQNLKENSYLNLLSERRSTGSKNTRRVEDPYWILDLVHAAGDYLEYEQDHLKSQKRKELKNKWFEDVIRYRKGMELRKKYRQEFMVSNCDAIMNRDITRTNNPHDFATNIVKQPSIEQFMTVPSVTVDEDACKTKRSETYCIDESAFERTLREYSMDKQAIDDDIEEMLQEQKKMFEMLTQWFSEVRNDSADMLADAINMEKDYVKQLIESTSKSKSGKKGKEKKKKSESRII